MDAFEILVLLGLMFFISVYGLYKSLRTTNSATADDFLLGKNVSVLSSALSVCSGFLSAISLLGFPAEVYYQGIMIFWYAPMYLVAFPMVAYLFLPVLHPLNLTSVYEYLEIRFTFGCRFLASITFCVQMILYLSVALYAPAIAISSVTSLSINISILLTSCLAAVYVSLGGAKAGTHTSSMQMVLIFVCMVVIIVGGFRNTSFSDVFTSAYYGRRLDFFDFRFDPRIRHSAWSLMCGAVGNILFLFAANQLSIQKYLAMPTLQSAQLVVLLNAPFNIFMISSYVIVGLLIYHTYSTCDPALPARDQLYPFFVIDRLSHFPGFVGLFTAAVYSAGISTLTASYSALSAVVIEDIIKQYMHKRMNTNGLSQSQTKKLAKLLPFVFCGITIVLAYLYTLTKTAVLQISFSIFGIAGGPVLGVFCIGLFFPYIRGQAAFLGLISSIMVSFFVAGGALVSKVTPVGLPLNHNCNGSQLQFVSDTDQWGFNNPLDSNSWLIQFFRVSYQYYSLISVTVAIVVAHCVQFLVGNHMEVDHRLISPLLRKFLPGKCDESTVSGRKSSVNIRKSGVETCELHEAVPLNKGCSTEPEL